MAMGAKYPRSRATQNTHVRWWVGLAVGSMLLPGTSLAQLNPAGATVLPGIGGGASTHLHQNLAPGQSLFSAGIRATALRSDNLSLSQVQASSGSLIEAAPWASYQTETTRGRIDIQGALRFLASEGNGNGLRLRSDLSARSDLEITPSGLRVAARALTRTVNLDPFGSNSADPATQAGNVGTLRDLEVSPYFLGQLAGDGQWTLRYRLRHIDLGDSGSGLSLGANTAHQVLGSLRTDLSQRRLAISMDAQTRQVRYQNAVETNSGTFDIMSWTKASPALRVGAGVGWAYHDLLRNSAGDNSGAGPVASLEWNPTSRTTIKARWASRYYGDQKSAEIEHRHTQWRLALSYRANIADGNAASLGATSPESAPAPQSADTALQFSGLIRSPLVYVEQVRLSGQIQGARTQIRLSAFLNDRVSATSLAPGLTSDLRQTGLDAQGRYQLDGVHALSLTARHVLTESASGASQAQLSSLIGAWNIRLSPDWSLTTGARIQHQNGQGRASEFDEVAFFLATDYRFR
jgi:uncharacterized protein (PEP-CTERM system associated)